MSADMATLGPVTSAASGPTAKAGMKPARFENAGSTPLQVVSRACCGCVAEIPVEGIVVHLSTRTG